MSAGKETRLERVFVLFGRETCDACKQARGKLEYFVNRWHMDVPIVYYDVDQPEGMTESAWHDVTDIPTVILREGGTETRRWKLYPPRLSELCELFQAQDDGQALPEE